MNVADEKYAKRTWGDVLRYIIDGSGGLGSVRKVIRFTTALATDAGFGRASLKTVPLLVLANA